MDFLLDESLKEIDKTKIPKHIAIIMDGNGRWATNRSLPRQLGHQEGMKRVVEIVECSKELGIENLTLYAFSTENWKRPKIEVEALMNLLVLFIRNELEKIKKILPYNKDIEVIINEINQISKKINVSIEKISFLEDNS